MSVYKCKHVAVSGEKLKMTQTNVPLRNNALSYFQDGYSPEELDKLWKEIKAYMDSEFPGDNMSRSWSQIVDELKPPKPEAIEKFINTGRIDNSGDDPVVNDSYY